MVIWLCIYKGFQEKIRRDKRVGRWAGPFYAQGRTDEIVAYATCTLRGK